MADLTGRRVGVVTGTAMGRLMAQILPELERRTRAAFEVLVVENTLFGPAVTSAGLLPGAALKKALVGRGDLELALLPAESVNDDLLFMDDVHAHALQDAVPMPLRFSYHFVDALSNAEWGMRNAECIGRPSTSPVDSAFRNPHSPLEGGPG
jgi:hypothetical protein